MNHLCSLSFFVFIDFVVADRFIIDHRCNENFSLSKVKVQRERLSKSFDPKVSIVIIKSFCCKNVIINELLYDYYFNLDFYS